MDTTTLVLIVLVCLFVVSGVISSVYLAVVNHATTTRAPDNTNIWAVPVKLAVQNSTITATPTTSTFTTTPLTTTTSTTPRTTTTSTTTTPRTTTTSTTTTPRTTTTSTTTRAPRTTTTSTTSTTPLTTSTTTRAPTSTTSTTPLTTTTTSTTTTPLASCTRLLDIRDGVGRCEYNVDGTPTPVERSCTSCANALTTVDRCRCGTEKSTTRIYSWTANSSWGTWGEPRVTQKDCTASQRANCCVVSDTLRNKFTKKGVGASGGFVYEGAANMTRESFEALELGWYYNWNWCEKFTTSVQFVPTQFASISRPEIKERYKYMLGINEPDHHCQSAMTIYDVLVPYNQHTALMKTLRKKLQLQCDSSVSDRIARKIRPPDAVFNLPVNDPTKSVWSEIEKSAKYIGSPAPASKDAFFTRTVAELGGNDSFKWYISQRTGHGWFKRFMNIKDNTSLPAGVVISNPRYHFVCVHYYAPDPDAFIEWLKRVHAVVNKPIWITEYAPQTTGHAKVSGISQADVNNFITVTTKFFEETDWIHRYAWHNSYFRTTSLWTPDGELTETGIKYRDADKPYRDRIPNLQAVHEAEYDAQNLNLAS